MKKYITAFFQWFKKPQHTDHHPVIRKPIAYAFTVDGQHYYRFENPLHTPKKRWRWVEIFYEEYNRRFDQETLTAFFDKIMELSNSKSPEIGKIYQIANEGKTRSTWAWEEEATLKLASALFFNLDEDLTTYDPDYNQGKIETFKKKASMIDILTALSDESDQALNMSNEDLNIYLNEQRKVKEKQSQLISPKEED